MLSVAHKAHRIASTSVICAGQCRCARTPHTAHPWHSLLTSCCTPALSRGGGSLAAQPLPLVSLEKVVPPSHRTCHQFPGAFWPHGSLGTAIRPGITASHPSPAAIPGAERLQGWISASALGPMGPVGKQVQIDCPWDKRLLKERGKAGGNYFPCRSGGNSRVTGAGSGRAQGCVRARGVCVDLGCSEGPRCAHTNPDRHSKGTSLPRITCSTGSKHCLVLHPHWPLLEEGGALTRTSRGFNPPQISLQEKWWHELCYPSWHKQQWSHTGSVSVTAAAPGAVPNPAIPDQAAQKSLPIS